MSTPIEARKANHPGLWANARDLGQDVYVIEQPDNNYQITIYHWCSLSSQWRGLQRYNTVLMIGDLYTLEKEVYFDCCQVRGRVSSGRWNPVN